MFKNCNDLSSLFPYFLLFCKCDFMDDFTFLKAFDNHDELMIYACHNCPSKTYIREVKFYTVDSVTHADVTYYYKSGKSDFYHVGKD